MKPFSAPRSSLRCRGPWLTGDSFVYRYITVDTTKPVREQQADVSKDIGTVDTSRQKSRVVVGGWVVGWAGLCVRCLRVAVICGPGLDK